MHHRVHGFSLQGSLGHSEGGFDGRNFIGQIATCELGTAIIEDREISGQWQVNERLETDLGPAHKMCS